MRDGARADPGAGAAQLHFQDDVQEAPLELFHKLRLYADADPANQGTKKPVRAPQSPRLRLRGRRALTARPCMTCPSLEVCWRSAAGALVRKLSISLSFVALLKRCSTRCRSS